MSLVQNAGRFNLRVENNFVDGSTSVLFEVARSRLEREGRSVITLNNEDKQFAMLFFFAMFLMYFFVHVELGNVDLVCSLTVLIGGHLALSSSVAQ